MERIVQGVARFQREVFPLQKDRFRELSNSQTPEALFITCADSRIMPGLITQCEPGELFICRNAGNMIPPHGDMHGGVSATIEYAVCVLNVRHIIVCGHTDCGAMKGILHPEMLQDLPTTRSWLSHGEAARWIVKEKYQDLPEDQVMHLLTQENIVAQIANLRTHPCVAARVASGRIGLHAWMYHIASGHVECFDSEQGRFVPLEAHSIATAAAQPRFVVAG